MIVFMYIRQREPAKIVSKEWKLTIVFLRGLNVVSPEGNGRTQRVFLSQLAENAGYDLDFTAVDPDELMIATIYAAQGIEAPLQQAFEKIVQNEE